MTRSPSAGCRRLLRADRRLYGRILGLATMPGSWLAARLVLRTRVTVHTLALEALVVAVALWIGVTSVLQLMT